MPQQRPHILLITTDQQRHDALGINGNPVLRTPNLDALATSGVNFSRAYSTCPVCIPARRSLLTGLYPTTHGLVGYRDGLEYDPPFTLPGLLGDAGYQTQLIGKLHLHPQRKRYGFDHMIRSETSNWRPGSEVQRHNDYVEFLQSRGIQDHPHAHGINGNGRVARPFTWDEELHQTSWLADEAARFMTEWRDPSCPFFLHLSFFVPHPPLIAPQAYWDRYVGRPDLPAPALGDWAPRDDGNTRRGIAPDSGTGPFPRDEIMDAIAGYYALVNHVDDRIQYVLERWNEYGNPRAKEPMWVLFSTDHGEMLGDHHLWRKSLGYEGSAHIPFFITGNNVQMARRRTSDALVCLEDIAPTVLDLAGAPIPEGMDGRSLAPILRGEDAPPPRETLFGECLGPNNHFVVHGRHKYLWFAKTNEEQLFDLEADPRELHDLSGDAALLAPMRARLAAHLRDRTDYTYDLSALRPLANRRPTVFWPEERPISA